MVNGERARAKDEGRWTMGDGRHGNGQVKAADEMTK